MTDDARFGAASARFYASHRDDPRSIEVDGQQVPWSVHYHARLRHWLLELEPAASVPLQLAAACQHIRRWEVPREDYDEGRRGYRTWRSDLAKMHGEIAREILEDVGYDEATIDRVDQLLRKVGLGRDPEVRRFEDAICMVFFENEYVELASKHDDAKMIDILQRTWAKMTPAGHVAARALATGLPERERGLLETATSS
ncbi:MAG: DUF4202 domain-containing protein [Gemmatimonadota bacterium]|nr:DUF4202 domain-containing protein [Gemmatimonadota bacterium]MDH3424577.1 DUF4202 domain-containing protein [Gemmatimonadota bacterium]